MMDDLTRPRPLRVTVDVRIDTSPSAGAYGNLQLQEEFQLGLGGFTELAAVLGQFHALTATLKATDTNPDPAPGS